MLGKLQNKDITTSTAMLSLTTSFTALERKETGRLTAHQVAFQQNVLNVRGRYHSGFCISRVKAWDTILFLHLSLQEAHLVTFAMYKQHVTRSAHSGKLHDPFRISMSAEGKVLDI